MALCLWWAGCGPPAPPPVQVPVDGLVAVETSGDLTAVGPEAADWARAPAFSVELLAQDVVEPKLRAPQISRAEVRCLFNATHMAFRLQWPDATCDDRLAADRFSDAAAVQLPTGGGAGRPLPDPLMGQPGRPVHIHLWKAAWQQAVGRPWTLQALHPNATVDHYPAAATQGADREALARQYDVAAAAGNRLALGRPSAVEDLESHGYGSLATLADQVSSGRGTYRDGRWSVVIARPLTHPQGEAFARGDVTAAAFAVWDGSAGQAGSRKARSGWVKLTLGATP